VKDVGEPCAGEPHARFDGEGLETEQPPPRQPLTQPTSMRTTRVAALILAVCLALLPAGLAVAQPTPGGEAEVTVGSNDTIFS
jgi:hypothetical protein